MGYRFQFVTLAGFQTLNLAMFRLALRLETLNLEATQSCSGVKLGPLP